MDIEFQRVKKWLVKWEERLDPWPMFKEILAAHQWTTSRRNSDLEKIRATLDIYVSV